MNLKKIVNNENKERKRKRNYIIIGIALILLMVISPVGYTIFNNNSGNSEISTIKYRGIDFIKNSNGLWEFQYNGQRFITKYNPLELNDTKVSTGLSLANYKDQVLYYEFNESQEGVSEVLTNLWNLNQVPKRIWRACLSEDCQIDVPVKSCSEDKIISFRFPAEDEIQRVYKEDNCVFIVANETNQVKYSDAFLYNLLGIN